VLALEMEIEEDANKDGQSGKIESISKLLQLYMVINS
jgi:hypothetical protein